MNWRRELAMALFRAGGIASRVKTPRRTRKLVSIDPFVTEPSEVRWLPSRIGIKLLSWASQLDWDHWDHWALDHRPCIRVGCDPMLCNECGGWICGDEEMDHLSHQIKGT